MNNLRDELWPYDENREEAQREAERKRRARERQQRALAEMQEAGRKFIEQNEKTMDLDEGSLGSTSEKTYTCTSCIQTTSCTYERPVGLVVFLQTTSVLGHQTMNRERVALLPSDGDSALHFLEGNTRRYNFRDREKNASEKLKKSWPHSVNFGLEEGVYVQTCGHHMHLDCLESYLKTLEETKRQGKVDLDRDEYRCPFCKQLANAILPLMPESKDSHPKSHPRNIDLEIFNNLQNIKQNCENSNFIYAIQKFVKNLSNFTKISEDCSFPFLTSVAHTNFEIELIQRYGTLSRPPPDFAPLIPASDCKVSLLRVLAIHTATLEDRWPFWPIWQQLTHVVEVKDQKSDVPLLLRDPTVTLIQFVLLLPLHLDETHFLSLVRSLYNLLFYQIVVQLSYGLCEAELDKILNDGVYFTPHNASGAILYYIIRYFRDNNLFWQEMTVPDEEILVVRDLQNIADDFEPQIQSLCLPFLRIAALLRHHLFGQSIPDIGSLEEEFLKLVYYLELESEPMPIRDFNAARALNWRNGESALKVPQNWCDTFRAAFTGLSELTVPSKSLIVDQHISWHMPKLLKLPPEYEKIFTYYDKRRCHKCGSMPSVCLLCGKIMCLKNFCCNLCHGDTTSDVCETVRHATECGSGTGIFLDIASTCIIVIRGKRACEYDPLYLNKFREIDKGWTRGEPLVLSEDRYKLLEERWLGHKFDQTDLTWFWHQNRFCDRLLKRQQSQC